MFDGLMQNFRKPKGFIGGLIVSMMNAGHATLTRNALDMIGVKPNDIVLDIGCGGGNAIALMTARGAEVHGIDISEVSVAKSRRKNQAAIREGRVHVQQAGVDDLPFSEPAFDLVTAFETVYFWENLEENFKSMLQILKPGGRFAIIVEAYREGDKIVNFPAMFKAVNPMLYSMAELEALLRDAGFGSVSCLRPDQGNWRCVCAEKLAPV